MPRLLDIVRLPNAASPPGAAYAEPSPSLLGQKGAGLVTMRRLGLPVPPGFVLTTALCRRLLSSESADCPLEALWADVDAALGELLQEAAERWPDRTRIAVRSAPTVSMPGIMDSLLDVDVAQGSASLRAAVLSVLRSADAQRARDYRRLYGLPEPLEVAVVVQAMVYGDRGESSAAGVLFTRDPSTGDAILFGEFLPQSRGEDVVSGRVTPRPLVEMSQKLPAAYAELVGAARRIEYHCGDAQDIEFTIEEGALWLLQTRSAKRSARAMLRIAVDLCQEGIIDAQTALSRIESRRLGEVLRPTVQSAAERTLLSRGLPASPGAASGRVVFDTAAVETHARAGVPTLLVRSDTSPEDIAGIKLAAGLLTARGGMTSHAAVVARGLGRCAVVGATGLTIDAARQTLSTREHVVRAGELLTLDGNSGEVWLGEVPLEVAHLAADPYLSAMLAFTAARRLHVYALADGETDLRLVRDLFGEGAEGVVERRVTDLRLQRGSATTHGREVLPATSSTMIDATGCDFLLLSADLDAELDDTVARLRAAHPTLLLGLATTRLRSDEVEAVARAAALSLDFVACPPLRLAIAAVAAAQAATPR